MFGDWWWKFGVWSSGSQVSSLETVPRRSACPTINGLKLIDGLKCCIDGLTLIDGLGVLGLRFEVWGLGFRVGRPCRGEAPGRPAPASPASSGFRLDSVVSGSSQEMATFRGGGGHFCGRMARLAAKAQTSSSVSCKEKVLY